MEICSNEDGLLGSYFVAKVVSRLGKDKFMVEYSTLLSNEHTREPLREVVKSSTVRPLPPEVRVPGFDVLDKVDAYDLDGWWVGRVTGMDASNYYVYFDSSGDEFAYPVWKLRVHQEFVNGEWVSSVKNRNRNRDRGMHDNCYLDHMLVSILGFIVCFQIVMSVYM